MMLEPFALFSLSNWWPPNKRLMFKKKREVVVEIQKLNKIIYTPSFVVVVLIA